VDDSVAATVAPVRDVASKARYIDSIGCINPLTTNIQKPGVNQSLLRIHHGALSKYSATVVDSDISVPVCRFT
jgi:hypothetical protein